MTRLLHAKMIEDPAYPLVAESLTVSHEHGTYNPVADAFSQVLVITLTCTVNVIN